MPDATPGSQPVQFTADSAERIGSAVKAIERALKLFPYQAPSTYRGSGGGAGALAITYTAIPSCTGDTPTSGLAYLYSFDGNTTTPDADTTTVYSWLPGRMLANSKVILTNVNGYWFVDAVACPSIY